MQHHNQQYYQRTIRSRHQSRSVIGSLFRLVVFAMLAIAVIAGGLWLVGATIGLVVGLVALAIGLAPLFLVGWLVWLIIRAIFV